MCQNYIATKASKSNLNGHIPNVPKHIATKAQILNLYCHIPNVPKYIYIATTRLKF